MADKPDQHLHSQRAKDRAFVLLILGVALLMPPLANIFNIPKLVAGIPLPLIYLFLVWAFLIVGTYLATRQLRKSVELPNDEMPSRRR